MHPIATAGLAVVFVVSVMLWLIGSRFARRHVSLNGAMPPLTWMFRRADDADLERYRRNALVLLLIDIAAFATYLMLS